MATDDHQPIAVGELKTMGRAVAWDSTGSWLVVGLGGRVGRRNGNPDIEAGEGKGQGHWQPRVLLERLHMAAMLTIQSSMMDRS